MAITLAGSAQQRQAAGWAVSGGILLELVLAGRASVTGKHLELVDTTPTGDSLLDSRTALIETWMRVVASAG
ncbi:GPP34 family phosphoprotein [Streptomyces sp. APSN-46.1]|uniref:GPP34 family phosphoprotein n=1 Tax=Streptomyces sp. APSN-46.1 TaxID=2929049 RepID=UPI0027E3FDF2|nr:GPP34 family phosphoprotein [Streptomyces sp. APSN-46.1]